MQAVIWRCTYCKKNFIYKYIIDFVQIFCICRMYFVQYLCRNNSGACKKFFYALSACVCPEIVNWGGGCFCHRLMPAKHGRYKLCTLQATRGLQIQIQNNYKYKYKLQRQTRTKCKYEKIFYSNLIKLSGSFKKYRFWKLPVTFTEHTIQK